MGKSARILQTPSYTILFLFGLNLPGNVFLPRRRSLCPEPRSSRALRGAWGLSQAPGAPGQLLGLVSVLQMFQLPSSSRSLDSVVPSLANKCVDLQIWDFTLHGFLILGTFFLNFQPPQQICVLTNKAVVFSLSSISCSPGSCSHGIRQINVNYPRARFFSLKGCRRLTFCLVVFHRLQSWFYIQPLFIIVIGWRSAL